MRWFAILALVCACDATPVAVGSWALDRINQRELPLDGVLLPRGLGRGVNVYVLDTGVEHTQLAPLPEHRGDFVHDTPDAKGTADCHGHGTHLAGIVGGVASAARLYSLRVADCTGQGSPEALLEAITWLEVHVERPAVALMSLQYRDAPELEPALRRLLAAGIVLVAAGGETLEDACTMQPSGTPGVLTVLGADETDTARERSNWGPCIALWAPGSDIHSLGPSQGTDVVKSGSSMAAAFVAGAAAIYLSHHPAASPAEVEAQLRAEATPARVRMHRPLHAARTSRSLLFVPRALQVQSSAVLPTLPLGRGD